MDVTEAGHFCRQSGEVNPSPFEQRPSQSVIGLVFPDEERYAAVIQEPLQGAVPLTSKSVFRIRPALPCMSSSIFPMSSPPGFPRRKLSMRSTNSRNWCR